MEWKEKVLAQYDFNSSKKIHWKIYYGLEAKQSNLYATTEVLPVNLDATLSRKKLVEQLDLLPSGDFLIQFKDAPNSSQSIVNYQFEVGHIYPSTQQNANVGVPRGMVATETVATMIESAVGKLNAEWQTRAIQRELEEVRKELKEVKKSKEGKGGLNELLPVIKGAMEMFRGLAAQNPAPAMLDIRPAGAIAGPKKTPISEDEEIVNHFNNVLKTALGEIYTREGKDADGIRKGIILIACLNEWIKENPQQYAMIKPTILKHEEKFELYEDEEETEAEVTKTGTDE